YFGATKTEAVVLTRKYIYTDPELILEGHYIPVKRHIRYLGVELDTRLYFTRHVALASVKATESAKAIGRLKPNVGGLSQAKRAPLGSVKNSKLLYASPIWAKVAVRTAKNRAAMSRAQRTTALRTIRAYRTVSADAAMVLSCTLSADILVHERARIRGSPKLINQRLTSFRQMSESSRWPPGRKDGIARSTDAGPTAFCRTYPAGFRNQHQS
ncbi:uncharacterized protein LOC112591324, partial [Melanaphis sacchari]|uniref:uncharacterized protein LOC112591324 n=1 Tax=Melanaphis sacchari TaxID=742174 RepID=UPI000DC133B6